MTATPIETYFEQTASYWDDVYGSEDLWGAIYRRRQQVALSWIDRLGLAPGTGVLEIGCGTGLTAVALAQRGLNVDAVDSVPAMLERTRRRADGATPPGRVRTFVADAESLDFEDESFGLVLTLGVTPWVPSPSRMVSEIRRVLKPGGHLLLTADNRVRLTNLLDPACSLPLRPVARIAGRLLVRFRLRRDPGRTPAATMHRPAEVDGWLHSAGLVKAMWTTVGFGPFTLLGHPVLPGVAALWVHRSLDRLADQGVPVLRSAGNQYIVLARREP